MNRKSVVRGAAAAVVGLLAITTLMVPATAHVNSPLTFKHLKKHFYTKGQLKNPGTINKSNNPVHWTKLKGVPTGIADGTDANATGTTAHKLGPADVPGGAITDAASVLGTLSLAAGKYVILADVYFEDKNATADDPVHCRLEVGVDADEAKVLLPASSFAAISLHVGQTLSTAGTVTMRCTDSAGGGNSSDFRRLQITAIELGSLPETTIP